MRVLAIEDNRQFLELMRSHLVRHGFTVDTGSSVADAMTLAPEGEHDVILLDLMLPDGDGSSVIKALRRGSGTTPVIVLSARGEVAERVALLNAGADDYLVKPCDLDELVARIAAVARRGPSRKESLLEFADIEFTPRLRQASVAGRSVALRPREASLLELLLRHAGEPVHRDVLVASLYSLDQEIGSNSLDVHVHHLRRRLAEAGAKASVITARGYGYALRETAV
jgi:DNA-binding response OmpR family regulator